MNGLLAILVVLLCVLGAAVVCLLVIAYDNKHTGSSRPAQRQHDREYAPVRDVYVVLQTNNHYTTYEEHTHQDNRQIHIHSEQPTLGTGRTTRELRDTRPALPRQRAPHRLPG
jgi:hypothetical protein